MSDGADGTDDAGAPDRVASAETTLAVVHALRDLGGAGVTELAAHLDVSKSTVHRHLATLLDAEYLVREGDDYHLSLRFLTLGEHVRDRRDVARRASSRVDALAEETNERAQFIVEEHGYAVYVHTAMGDRAVRTDSGAGVRIPMNSVSAGKAILAHLPEERVRAIVDRRGLPARTESTITDEAELFAELERVRERGYAINREESTPGLHAVSAPVMGPEGGVLGALGVSGPTHRLKGARLRETVPDLLLGVVNELELDLQY
jgi:DNA-binding IclR family transcriptional regulator